MPYRLPLALTLMLLAGCVGGMRPVIDEISIEKCPPTKPKLEYLEENKCPSAIPLKGTTLRSFYLAWDELVLYARCKATMTELWVNNWDDCP